MKNLVIVTLFAVFFQIGFAFPNVLNRDDTSKSSHPYNLLQHSKKSLVTRHESNSSTDLEPSPLEPRDIISDMLGPTLQKLVGLLGSNLYALSYAFFSPPPPPPSSLTQACRMIKRGEFVSFKTNIGGHKFSFGDGSTLPALKNRDEAQGIPILGFEGSVFVEGKKGNISVNHQDKYFNDEMLLNGEVHIRIQKRNFYVNNNLVLRGNPGIAAIFVLESLDYEGVSAFKLEIDSVGFVHYIDDKLKSYLHVNYRCTQPRVFSYRTDVFDNQ